LKPCFENKPSDCLLTIALVPAEYLRELIARMTMIAMSRLHLLLMRNGATGRLFGGYFGAERAAGVVRFGESGGLRGGRGRQAACMAVYRQNEALKIVPLKTITYGEGAITSACYLCNTHPKTV
jgi:hypothetical protein